MDKYLKYQEKIEENNTESYKDFQNSMYNDISYEKMETGVNPLELQNAQFSNFSDDKTKTTLENIKDRLPKKYVNFNFDLFFIERDFDRASLKIILCSVNLISLRNKNGHPFLFFGCKRQNLIWDRFFKFTPLRKIKTT